MARRAQPQQANQLQSDANEFGVGVRCGGWRLGLLVARNVEPGKAGRPKAEPDEDNRSPMNDSGKVSMNKFAELAQVPVSKVKYYYDAWELAAKASLVPHAATIPPADEDICIDADAIEVENDPKTSWSWFYSMAVNPPKPKEQKQDSKPAAKEKTEPELPKSNSNEDDSVDDDFGIQSATKEQVREADSDIQRNALLEALESLRSVQSRVEQSGISKGSGPDGVLSQISSLAFDLATLASGLKSEAKETESV